jgi:PAS domain S-box-containing protein
VLVLASILHLEGAYEFRALSVRRRFVYTGGVVAIGGVAFFLYIVPNLNARAAIVSAFLAVVFMRGTTALLWANPPMYRLGLRLTGILSGLCAATHTVRVVYCAFGPPITNLFPLSGSNGATFLLLSAELSLLPIGYILLADERVIWDLKEAKQRAGSLQESIRKSEERQAWLLKLSDTLRPLASPAEIQFTAARLLGEQLRVNRVVYADIEDDHYIMRQSWTSDVAPFMGRPVTIFGKTLLGSYRDGETVVVSNVRTDPRFTVSERSTLLSSEIAAFTGLMRLKSGQWVSAFSAESATPRLWPREEIELIRDVAERTWDAVERACAAEVLRESEQRLRLALNASMAGVWTWDPFTNQSRWDDRLHAQYGFAEGAPQTFDTWISSVHEGDRPKVLAHLDDVLHLHQNDWNIVFRAVRPDGTVRWMHNLGRADRATDGQVTRMSGINLDITEQRRAEEVLQTRRNEERERALQKQAQEALRRSHTELEQSHAELERRTLQLSRLASQLTLAEQSVRKQLAGTLHDGLQQLLFSAAITLDHTVQSNAHADQVALLQRARAVVNEAIESTRTLAVNLFPPVLHVGGLPAALRWVAKRVQDQYNVVVNVTADPQANPETSEVRILLFEGVRELLFNAVKHARVDRVDVNLALGLGDTIQIQVSDEGVGFDPTATLHDRNQPEAGLGLFSIQERFALLGGHLDIVSAPRKGSRFTLTLPRTRLPGLAANETEAPRCDTDRQECMVYNARGTSKALRILIADDHPVVRAGLREMFGNRPLLQVVGEAANGVEAISHAKALQPDVILMDVAMPQKNGIEATREIHETLPHIQIVGLSTHGDETTEREMREAGAQWYFTKTEGIDRVLDHLLSLRAQIKAASAM